jgi:adenylate cyclase
MLARAVQRVGVAAPTLRRWIRGGLVPQYDGSWTPAAIGQGRVVATMRERGHSLRAIRRATEQGKVLVTRAVVDSVSPAAAHLEFERIGEVRLKGFSESTEVFVARRRAEE